MALFLGRCRNCREWTKEVKMLPLLPLAVGATVAGIGFGVGQKLSDAYLIPWATDVAKNWRKS